jgi:flagella basal body P-ring formation protein FlgA
MVCPVAGSPSAQEIAVLPLNPSPHLLRVFLPLLRRTALRATLVLAGLGSAMYGGPLLAQAVTDPAADLGPLTQRWLDNALASSPSGGLPLRMEVSVGTLDSRLRLAPCARVEPYLPAGSRLWGRTRLGLRCVEGATAWNVFLPVTIKAFGPAWVLNNNVTTGTVLTAADASESEVDWAAEVAPVIANPEQWVGQVASRQLMAGQAVRQSMVRAPSVFRAGAQVRVVAQGPGYSVTSSGQAMSNGTVGQTVRIRMSNGRLISGIVNEDGTIAASL